MSTKLVKVKLLLVKTVELCELTAEIINLNKYVTVYNVCCVFFQNEGAGVIAFMSFFTKKLIRIQCTYYCLHGFTKIIH